MKLKIEESFGVAPNSLLNNEKISLKAKGLFVYIQSKPDGWNFSAEKISLSHRDGLASVIATLKELEEFGYLIRRKLHGANGHWEQTYELCLPNVDNSVEKVHLEPISPSVDFPQADKPQAEKPFTENHINNSNKDTSKKELVKKTIVDERFEKFWELYNKDIGKDECYKVWRFINPIDKDKILKVLPLYIESTPEIKYRKNPLKYLNNKAWLDEIIRNDFGNKEQEKTIIVRPVSTIVVPNDF